MSKSLGNTVTLKDAFRTWGARVVRFFILQSHYRSTLDFSNDAVEGASRGLEKLDGTLQRVDDRLAHPHPGGGGARRDLEHHRRAFLEAMDDDFNTPRAIAVLFDLARDVNQLLSGEAPIARETLEEIRKFYDVHAGQVLGMEIGRAGEVTGRSLEDGLLNLLASLRRELRAQKLWPLADRIRHELAALGVTMEDGKEGTTWKRTS
jgi:cysteinyl-tRNA synthetase